MSPFSARTNASELIRLSAERDFSLGDLDVRPSLREIGSGDRKEQIEPRVMQVLVALAQAGGAVVSRDELIQRCWEGRIVGEAAINRCILKLRDLTESFGPGSFRIETIPRVGYRLLHAGEPPRAQNKGVDESEPALATRRKFLWLLPAFAVPLAVGALLLGYEIRHGSVSPHGTAPPAAQPSIAVLPFQNLSADKDAGYLAAGVQDEILTRLAKIGSLKVISRTSADQFAGSSANIPAIARKLGVANILEGNVQKSGNTVRINVQLIRAASDDHLWAEDYDRSLDDVLSVESEVASTIAVVLAAKLTPGERREIAARPTTNPRAYDLYLRALTFAHKTDHPSLKTAEQFLTQATGIDPGFALAWAWLARDEAFLHFGDDLATVRRGAAHAALERVLALQPNLPEAQVAKGFYLYYGERNYRAAGHELEQVHARWPNNAEALEALGLILRREGKLKDSTAAFERLVVLDPLVPVHRIILAGLLDSQHDLAGAMRVLDTALQTWPDNNQLLDYKAGLYQEMGRLDLAAEQLKNLHPTPDDFSAFGGQLWLGRQYRQGAALVRSLIAQEPENPGSEIVDLRMALGDFLRMSGDARGAKESYSQALGDLLPLLKKQPDNSDMTMFLILLYADLGERDLALSTADHALSVFRASGDALDAENAETVRATVLVRLGDRGQAIAELARLMKLVGNINAGELRLDPDFDRLRGDPRFENLLKTSVSPIDSK